MGVPVETLNKLGEGSPHVVDWIERGDVDLVINTPAGTGARSDGYEIRAAAVARGIPCITTLSGGIAATRAIAAARQGEPPVLSLQELHLANGAAASASPRAAEA
jgi:carbamoyl-phosphate synthase large subunit